MVGTGVLLLLALARADVFDEWIAPGMPVADGFHLPANDAAAAGIVVEVDPDTVVVAHTWYENHERREARVRYDGLGPVVRVGDRVRAGQILGAGQPTVRAEIDGKALDVRLLVDGRGRLPVPQEEPVLLVVSHDLYEMRVYRRAVEVARYPVSFGQAVGQKRRRGDNRTPKGMYFVVYKTTGPFSGPEGPFYGGHWIKIDYPNPYDVEAGIGAGLVDESLLPRTREAWSRRALTPQDTALGGGIGIHGWAWEWDLSGPRHLSWGCIVMQPSQVDELYASIETGAMVVLL